MTGDGVTIALAVASAGATVATIDTLFARAEIRAWKALAARAEADGNHWMKEAVESRAARDKAVADAAGAQRAARRRFKATRDEARRWKRAAVARGWTRKDGET